MGGSFPFPGGASVCLRACRGLSESSGGRAARVLLSAGRVENHQSGRRGVNRGEEGGGCQLHRGLAAGGRGKDSGFVLRRRARGVVRVGAGWSGSVRAGGGST